jgi:hypothetical protein
MKHLRNTPSPSNTNVPEEFLKNHELRKNKLIHLTRIKIDESWILQQMKQLNIKYVWHVKQGYATKK